ncbi:MAG: hypothetical protein JWQ22_893 [Devosia sp.]|nr:hypothetical protein [Devosia sp.]
MTNKRAAFLVASSISLGLLLSSPSFSQTVEAKPASDAFPMMVVDTPHFLSNTMSSNQFEIKSSELALEKDVDAETTDLAKMIIADHKAAGEKLDGLLADNPNKPAAEVELAPKQAKMLAQLEAADGADFKPLYLDIQAQAHMEAIALFRTYAGAGDDQTLVGFAKETLPALETHAAHVDALIKGKGY